MTLSPYTAALPPLTEDEYAALKADIARRGLQVPVDVDENGVALDGAHRLRACAELGIEPGTRVVTGLTEAQKYDYAISMNAHRRQLGPVAQAHLFRRRAELAGVRFGSQGGRPGAGETRQTVAGFAAENGVSARTARNRFRLAALADDERYRSMFERVEAGELSASTAMDLAAERDERERRAQEPEFMALAAMSDMPPPRLPPRGPLPVAEIPVALGASERHLAYMRRWCADRELPPPSESNAVKVWRLRLDRERAKPRVPVRRLIADADRLLAVPPEMTDQERAELGRVGRALVRLASE